MIPEVEKPLTKRRCMNRKRTRTGSTYITAPAATRLFIGRPLSFTHAWGDFVGPAMFLSQDSTTLAVAMATGYVNDKGLPMNNLVAAGAVMYVLPVLVLFLFMQRRFVSGFSTSGIK